MSEMLRMVVYDLSLYLIYPYLELLLWSSLMLILPAYVYDDFRIRGAFSLGLRIATHVSVANPDAITTYVVTIL